MSADLRSLTKALVFAAEAHRNQRRKGAAQEPYLNHLIEVLDLVVKATDGADMDILIAALLHDVVEDTSTSYEDVAANFGERIAEIFRENSDDMSLPKADRRLARIAAMPLKSREARLVKLADVISNLRAIAVSPPVERTIREEVPFAIEGREVAARQLENAVGQAVHLVYLLNTEGCVLGATDVDRLCELIGGMFPSATVQPAEAIYEGQRRSILMARIRTDSTDAVVDLAQRLCVVFHQRFVGVEVGGRYIRIYGDDTE